MKVTQKQREELRTGESYFKSDKELAKITGLPMGRVIQERLKISWPDFIFLENDGYWDGREWAKRRKK